MKTQRYGKRYNLSEPTNTLDNWLSRSFEPVPPPIPYVPPATYTCPKCNVEQPQAAFHSKTGRRYAVCTGCRKAKARAEYKENRPRHLDRKAIKSQLLQQFGAQCERCGYSEFDSALEFHHNNRKTKDSQVSQLIGQYAITPSDDNWDRLIAECGKCSILCSNCHQALHANDW